MRLSVLISVAMLSGCARCQSAGTPDAGAAHVRRQTDLRSALLIIFPEYRGTRVTSGIARLTRTVTGSADAASAAAKKTLEVNGFASSNEGAVWSRPPYEARVDGATWVIAVPLDQDTVERVYMAPTAMSTADLAMWFPRAPMPFATANEVFDLELRYDASPEPRSTFLTRQLVQLLLGSGQWRALELPEDWNVDGGQPGLFNARLEQVSSHASFTIRREGHSVSLHYTLVTDEP